MCLDVFLLFKQTKDPCCDQSFAMKCPRKSKIDSLKKKNLTDSGLENNKVNLSLRMSDANTLSPAARGSVCCCVVAPLKINILVLIIIKKKETKYASGDVELLCRSS